MVQKSRVSLLLLPLALVLVSFIFHGALAAMAASWQQEEYSHGALIPFVALVLLFNAMGERPVAARASWVGVVVIALCIVAQFFLETAGIHGITPEIYLICLIGVFILFWGTDAARAYAGPLAFLMFTAPLPHLFYYALSVRMQMLSTSLGTELLDLLSVPVFQDGNVIDLGGYRLEVAQACNGLRYLFPLMSLGFLLAYMYRAPLLKRVILFLSAMPVAILMNGMRIAVIGITVDHWGPRMAEGVLHEAEGGMVFLGCAACLLVEVSVLQRIGKRGTLDFTRLRIPGFRCVLPPAMGRPVVAGVAAIMIGVAASVWSAMVMSHQITPVPLRQPFTQFPLKLGPWVGHFGRLDARALSVLGTDDYLIADYVKPGAPPVNLYALYYAEQDSTSNEAIHDPSGCIPAGGWTIESDTHKAVTLQNGETLTVNRVVVAKDLTREVVYYWFVEDGRATWNPNKSKLYQVKDAFTKGRTNGAMIRLVTPLQEHESEDAADQRLAGFMQDSLATLEGFMFPKH